MNLKEAFRYQSFLNHLIDDGCYSISSGSHAFVITKNHHRSKANPEAEDLIEEVSNCKTPYYKNDDVIGLLLILVNEKGKLTREINIAKSNSDDDIDAMIESNKARQRVTSSIEAMLQYKASDTVERECDFKFNVDGNQVAYYYDVEISKAEDFNRDAGKRISKILSGEADKISTAVDVAMINTHVNYDPIFDVNSSFEDVMEEYLAEKDVK